MATVAVVWESNGRIQTHVAVIVVPCVSQQTITIIRQALERGGDLHNVFQAMTAREKKSFVGVVMATVDKEITCQLIACPYHDHSRPLPDEEESDSDDEMYAPRSHLHRKRMRQRKGRAVSPPRTSSRRRSSVRLCRLLCRCGWIMQCSDPGRAVHACRTCWVLSTTCKQAKVYEGMDVEKPWERFLRKPPKALELPRLQMAQALSMIYECYEKKVAADQIDDRVSLSLPVHCHGQPVFSPMHCFRLARLGIRWPAL